MAIRSPFSSRLLGRLAISAGIVVAAVVGLAPHAWAGHSEVQASVSCLESGQLVLDWEWTAHRHQEMDPPAGHVAVEYGPTDALAEPDRVWVPAAEVALTDMEHLATGGTVLTPPPGATSVRLQIYAHWNGTTVAISWLQLTTDWLELPDSCVEPQDEEPTDDELPIGAPPIDASTTTTTSSPSGVAGDTSTTTPPTTVAPQVLGGGASGRAAVVPVQVAPAQAAPAPTLPDTGSTSGVMAAAATLLVALGGGLYAAGRTGSRPG